MKDILKTEDFTIPEGVTDEQALYLSDVLSTSYHCVMDTGIEEGDTVGIWVCPALDGPFGSG